ncbi:TetR/AcrR family transcriptional regulator [Rhodococcus sp. CX]|uniref:TetR/AcrR family transcriptional regulator n=1 Tax=Rhodococcus sp. CX TaxID=2789880 RepID=UPI0018CF116B|nr:TetR/AcrR family transcriptional regulator [Rhodococcus sp. CX]MBH0123573.1 TetR/AcrR family transcriptional regulator [Rhodococcus sp. CX]
MTETVPGRDDTPPVIPGGRQLRRVPKPRRQASYDDEVKLLIRAAQSVMLRKGCTEQPKIAEIVGEAGMSNQAFYRNFRSRDDVIVATYEQGLLNIHAYLERRVRKQTGLEPRLAAWIDGVLAQIEDHELSELSRVIIWNMGQIARTKSEIEPVGHTRIRELLCRVLDESGVADPERTAVFVHTLVMGLMTTYLESGDRPTEEARAHLLRFCVGAITEH